MEGVEGGRYVESARTGSIARQGLVEPQDSAPPKGKAMARQDESRRAMHADFLRRTRGP